MTTSPLPKPTVMHLITGLQVGGAEMMLKKTVPLLEKDFPNVVCVLRGNGELGKDLLQKGIAVEYLHLDNFWDLIAVWPRFWRITRKYKPAVLITYLIHSDLFGRIAGRLFGIRTVLCSQRGSLHGWKFLRPIDRMTKYLVTRYVCQTTAAKKELCQVLRLYPNQVKVIPNGIEIERFDAPLDREALRKELSLDKEAVAVICVSNIKTGKGHEYLIPAFAELAASRPNAWLLLVGDGPQRSSIENIAEGYACRDRIRFLGRRKDVRELLAASDIFVLASVEEGMSNALLEAMASRLPAIVSDIPVNCEVVDHGHSGLLFRNRDTAGLSKALENLLDDPQLRRHLGQNAYRKTTELYEIRKVASRWASLISDPITFD